MSFWLGYLLGLVSLPAAVLVGEALLTAYDRSVKAKGWHPRSTKRIALACGSAFGLVVIAAYGVWCVWRATYGA